MTLRPELEQRLALRWPVERWADVPCMIACSGGADSTALLSALAALRPAGAAGELIVAHFNHRLRGAESDADATFVAELADGLDLRCVVGAGDVAESAELRGDGIEEAARTARYAFLVEQAKKYGARHVALAHTLDDQAETVLHRIVRGTGLSGLGGIPYSRPLGSGSMGLVRPLLSVRRSEVLTYLAAIGRSYRDDSSNADCRYTRNRLRHELLPRLADEYNPRIVDGLARLAAQADEYREFMRKYVDPLLATTAKCKHGEFELDCSSLVGVARFVVREMLVQIWIDAGLPLQAMGFEEWDALADLVFSRNAAARIFPSEVIVRRRQRTLIAQRTQTE